MNTIANAVEVTGEDLEVFLGQEVMLFCSNYIYAGVLAGVSDTAVKLNDAKIVYETGPFTTKGYKDAQSLPTREWYVKTQAIESFGPGK